MARVNEDVIRGAWLLALVLTAACTSPTAPRPALPTPVPVVPTKPPQSALALPTPQPTAVEESPLATVLDEAFDAPSLDWPIDAASPVWLANGALHMNARTPSQFVAFGIPGGDRFRDVVVTAQFRKEGGPAGGGFGIIVGDSGAGARDGTTQTGQYIVAEVGDQGTFGVWQRMDDHWVDVLPWTELTSARRGEEPNELSVRAIGARLVVSVNNQEAISLDQPTHDGSLGLFAGGDFNQVAVTHLRIQAPRPTLAVPQVGVGSATAPTTGASAAAPATRGPLDPNWLEHARNLIRTYDKHHGTVLDGALQRTRIVLARRTGAWAAFVPSLNTITLDPILQLERPEAVATVLGHEAVHASDTYLYGGSRSNVSCYSYEISAFHLQAVMWQEFFGPSGMSNAETDLELELNDIARSATTDAGRLISAIQYRYQDQCDGLPA